MIPLRMGPKLQRRTYQMIASFVTSHLGQYRCTSCPVRRTKGTSVRLGCDQQTNGIPVNGYGNHRTTFRHAAHLCAPATRMRAQILIFSHSLGVWDECELEKPSFHVIKEKKNPASSLSSLMQLQMGHGVCRLVRVVPRPRVQSYE